jgi:hypothetical protein
MHFETTPTSALGLHGPGGVAGDIVMDATRKLRAAPDRRDHASRAQLLHRVRAEFAEMRGLRLTRAQAQRLFGLRADVCDRILAALVDERTIMRDADHQFRATDETPTAGHKERLPD